MGLDPKIIARIHALRAEKKAIDEELEDLIGGLPALPVDNYVVGDFLVRVRDTVRFDAATAKRNLTPEQFESILKPTPNSALAKALLDSDYTLTQKVFGRQIRVEVPDNE